MPCPPGKLIVWDGVQKPTSEGDIALRKRLCGVRSTHNFDSSFAPKMI